MGNKNYTAGSLRILAAGLINNHELSPEAKRAAGEALADYARVFDNFSTNGRKQVVALVKRNQANMSSDPAAVRNRERVRRYRAKKKAERAD